MVRHCVVRGIHPLVKELSRWYLPGHAQTAWYWTVKVDDKSNEITAIPVLLSVRPNGCIVTIDAIGTQREIAQVITEAGANYVLSLKANQGTMHQDVSQWCKKVGYSVQGYSSPHRADVGQGAGRIERRRNWLIDDEAYLAYLNSEGKWANCVA
jgi:hypothetical protein